MPGFDAARLTEAKRARYKGPGYRNQTPGFDPRSGEGARRFGGRFNPPRSFPVIYLCTTRACSIAELTKQAERQSVTLADLLPRELWGFQLDLSNVLDLTNAEVLGATGLVAADLVRADHTFTQQIGEAAHARGHQAIRSASATGVDDVLAVLPDNLAGAHPDVELLALWDTLGDVE
jgi:RES domain-containing protein